MWLFTRNGFYSVVQDKKDERLIQLRARIKDDLENLFAFAAKELKIALPAIISTPQADYAYRVVVERTVWIKLASALAEEIDYCNFKDEVHGEHDRDDAYLGVWSEMHQLQQKRRRV